MNAYVSENHLMTGQLQLKDKEKKIVAIPQLIEKIDIGGEVVSVDAIGTQVNIAQDILDKKAHYFLTSRKIKVHCAKLLSMHSVITNLLIAPHRWKLTTAA